MALARRSQLVAVSLGCHAALGLGLAAMPPRHVHETIAITLAETKKPKAPPPPHADPPPDPPDPPAKATPRPSRAKTAPSSAKAPMTPSTNAQASSLDGLPDFGLSLSGGPGGLAIPSGSGGGGPGPASAQAAKVLSRRSRADDCDDPPVKPKPLTRPTAVYPRSEEGTGVTGKVRVEVTVDDHGRVSSARVIQSLGAAFDEAALAAARAYTFEPAVRCGKATSATLRIGFSF